MRISDWSSDVCSSDLGRDPDGGRHHVRHRIPDDAGGGGCAHVGEHHNRRLQRAIAALLQGAAMSDWGNQMRVIFAMPGNEAFAQALAEARPEEHTSELQSLMRTSYAVYCLKKKKLTNHARK